MLRSTQQYIYEKYIPIIIFGNFRKVITQNPRIFFSRFSEIFPRDVQVFGVSFNSDAEVKICEYSLRMPTTSFYNITAVLKDAFGDLFTVVKQCRHNLFSRAGYIARRRSYANRGRKVYSSREYCRSFFLCNRFLRRAFLFSLIHLSKTSE